MAPNHDGDEGSFSIEKYERESDVSAEWLELNLPEQREEEENYGAEIRDREVECEVRKNGDCDVKKVCNICEKVFSSGKALGGHMRSHGQLPNRKKYKADRDITFGKQNRRDEATAEEEASDNGGGGGSGNYMMSKCSCVVCDKNFPSMKSLFGHMRCHPDRDWRGVNPPSSPSSTAAKRTSSSSSSSLSDAINPRKIEDGRDRAVNLLESMKGWAVTAKRGRKPTAPAVEDDHRLREAVKFLMMLAEGKNSGESEGEVVDHTHEEKGSGGGGGESELQVLTMKNKKMKKRKKVKLSDLKLMENNGKCKSFPTNQSIHGVLDFDLNELPPSQPHQLLANYHYA